MADKKISELVSLAGKDVAATDFFPVVDVSVAETKSLTRDELRNAVNAIQFTATKALATTAAASLPDDTIIEVAADESLAGARTRYKVAAGALVFAYGVATQAELDAVAAAKVEVTATSISGFLSNAPTATRRNISVLGDSISHGAFALNTFLHGWARLLQRMVHAGADRRSYGFTPMLSLGSGGTATTEIHSVGFTLVWSGTAQDSDSATTSLTGSSLRSPGIGGKITLTLPYFQSRVGIQYIQQPGGGTFTVSVNGSITATVDTNGVLEHKESISTLLDANYGECTVVIEHTVAGTVDIVGPAYYAATDGVTFNNFSGSGRRLRYMSEAAIAKIMAQSSTVIIALGVNDYGDAATTPSYASAFSQRIDWLVSYAKAGNVKIVVPDLCMIADKTTHARAELKRLAKETNGVYIPLPEMIFSGDIAVDGNYLVNTLKMWEDWVHPNKYGHQWIAEVVAKAMSLSCSSKREAIHFHDWWMPLPLIPATGAYNTYKSYGSYTTAYKRNGADITIHYSVRKAEGGAFPIGTHAISAGFNPKSELSAGGGLNKVGYIRADTGAIVSVAGINASGAFTLSVYSSFITDQVGVITYPAVESP